MASNTAENFVAADFSSSDKSKIIQLLEREVERRTDELQASLNEVELLKAIISRQKLEVSELNEALFQAGKLTSLGEMTATVVHEFNQPLMLILGYIQLVISNLDYNDPNRRDLEKVERQILRLSEIVGNVRKFSRKSSSEVIELNILDPLEEAIALLSHQLGKSDISLKREFSEDLPLVLADGNQMQQVFVNILANARDAVLDQPDRRISLSAHTTDNAVIVSITNNGPEIPRELHEHIFEAFFTSKGPGKGTGLGLAISKKIMLEHGGSIQVRSDPDLGCSFDITLKRKVANG